MLSHWPTRPPNPQLSSGDVHVWQSSLNVSPRHLTFYESLLADDERERAARFHFERHRNEYIAGRGMLRVLLGRYLKKPPLGIEISYSEYNKPHLTGSKLRFNLAHSGGVVLYAFCLHDEVGVDIEVQRELSDAMAISERFFSPAERDALRALPEAERIPAFFRCWSRKEAFIKAIGEGLSYPLDAFDVTLTPEAPAQLTAVRGSEEEARRWSLFSLDLFHGYYGAVAVKNAAVHLRAWHFEE